MRFHIGTPLLNPAFEPESIGWVRLRQPSPWLLQLAAVPVAVLTTGIFVLAWSWLAPVKSVEVQFSHPAYTLLGLAGGVVGLFFLHELLHCVGHPGFGLHSASLLGLWPSRLMPYAAYHGSIARNRYILMGFMPLLGLTFLPLVVCAVFNISSLILAVVSMANGMSSAGDIIIFLLIWRQVPSQGVVQEQGWDTWWKVPENMPEIGSDEHS